MKEECQQLQHLEVVPLESVYGFSVGQKPTTPNLLTITAIWSDEKGSEDVLWACAGRMNVGLTIANKIFS